MLLFDTAKKLEKALGEEAATVLAHAFEEADRKWRHELATRDDLEKLELRLKHDLTLRLGGMMAASIAVVAALAKLL